MVVEGLCSEPSPFDGEPVRADLERRIVGVHETIKKRSADHVELLGMGSTVAGLLLSADRLLHFNVGDSRVYVQQAGELSQLSVDDCPAVGEFGRSHILTQALGGHSSPRPHLGEIQPAAGQKYLLCSDGLSDMVGDREIAGCLSNITDPVDHLLQSALDGGGRDNISLILIELF
jgi:serine/threonine protein phosphatase PrpC